MVYNSKGNNIRHTALKGQVMINQSGLVKTLSPWSPMKKAREMMVLPEGRE